MASNQVLVRLVKGIFLGLLKPFDINDLNNAIKCHVNLIELAKQHSPETVSWARATSANRVAQVKEYVVYKWAMYMISQERPDLVKPLTTFHGKRWLKWNLSTLRYYVTNAKIY